MSVWRVEMLRRAGSLFLLVIILLQGLDPLLPVLRASAAETEQSRLVLSNENSRLLRDRIREGFRANFSVAGPIERAEVDAFLRFLDEESYFSFGQSDRVAWMSEHREHQLTPFLMQLENLHYPPRAIRENPVSADLAFAAFATVHETGEKLSEQVTDTRKYWQQFFYEVASAYNYEFPGGNPANNPDYVRWQSEVSRAQAEARDPKEIEPPAEIKLLFTAAKHKGKFYDRDKHPELKQFIDLLYALGFPRWSPTGLLFSGYDNPVYDPNEVDESFFDNPFLPKFQENRRLRQMWVEEELEFWRIAWGYAYPVSHEGGLLAAGRSKAETILTLTEFAAIASFPFKQDPVTGEAIAKTWQEGAGEAATGLVLVGGTVYTASKLLPVVKEFGTTVGAWSVNKTAALLGARTGLPPITPDDLAKGTNLLVNKVSEFLTRDLLWAKKPQSTAGRIWANYARYESQAASLPDAERLLVDSAISAHKKLYQFGQNEEEARRVTRTLLSYLRGVSDEVELGRILAASDANYRNPTISIEELVDLMRHYGGTGLAEDGARGAAKTVRDLILRQAGSVDEGVKLVDAYYDLLLALRTQPSTFVKGVSEATLARGATWGEVESVLDKPIIEKLDEFQTWLFNQEKRLLVHDVEIANGPDMLLSMLQGKNPSPFTSPDLVIRYSASMFDELGDLVGKNPDELALFLNKKFREFMDTKQGVPLKTYYEELQKFTKKDEGLLRLTMVDEVGNGANTLNGLTKEGRESLVLLNDRLALDRYGAVPEMIASSVAPPRRARWRRFSSDAAKNTRARQVKVVVGEEGRAPTISDLLPGVDDSPERVSALADNLETAVRLLKAFALGDDFTPTDAADLAAHWQRVFGDKFTPTQERFMTILENALVRVNADKKIDADEIKQLRTLMVAINYERITALALLFGRQKIKPAAVAQDGVVTTFKVLTEDLWELDRILLHLDPVNQARVTHSPYFSVNAQHLNWRERNRVTSDDVFELPKLLDDLIFRPGYLRKLGIIDEHTKIPYELIDEEIIEAIASIKAQGFTLSDEVEAKLIAYAWQAEKSGRLYPPLDGSPMRKIVFDDFDIRPRSDFIVPISTGTRELGVVPDVDLLKMFDDVLVYDKPMTLEQMRRPATRVARTIGRIATDPTLKRNMEVGDDVRLGNVIKEVRFIDELATERGEYVLGLCDYNTVRYCIAPDTNVSHYGRTIKIDRRYFFEDSHDISEILDTATLHEAIHSLEKYTNSYYRTHKPIIEGLVQKQTELAIAVDRGYTPQQMLDYRRKHGYRGWVSGIDVLIKYLAFSYHGNTELAAAKVFSIQRSADPAKQFGEVFNEIHQFLQTQMPSGTEVPRPWGTQTPHDWFSAQMEASGSSVSPSGVIEWYDQVEALLAARRASSFLPRPNLLVWATLNMSQGGQL